MRNRGTNGGFALLMVVIAVAIILVLTATQLKTLFLPAGTPGPKPGTEQHPWVLADLLVAEGKRVKRPGSSQPSLETPVTVQAAVALENAPRGTVSMTFGADGRMAAAWECGYVSGEQTHTITATMAGNVVAGRTYTDAQGRQDKRRLFFVARGRYQKHTRQPHLDPADEKGTAWVFGWLGPDHTADGFVCIHPGTEWVAAYPFTTE